VLAFHDDLSRSKGTRHMVEAALAAGLPVFLFTSHSKPHQVTGATGGLFSALEKT